MNRSDLLISAAQLNNLLGVEGSSLTLLDCRFNLMDPNEGQRLYEDAHIPGAHYLNLNEDLSGAVVAGVTGRHPLPDFSILASRLASLGVCDESDIVVYDQRQAGYAGRCWWLLRHLGLSRVRVLDGGFEAWRAASGALSRSAPHAQPCAWSPKPGHTPVAHRDDVANLSMARAPGLWHERSTREAAPFEQLLDARDLQRYLGHHEPIDSVAGHIPGALCRPFVDNLDDAGCFLPAETLRNQFLSLGLNDGAKVTCYCGSGVTATVNMIALLLAGFGEPALYAGSFSDWITHPQHPIGRANDQLSR